VGKLAFAAPAGKNPDVNSLVYLAAANVVVWVGLFFYLWRLDRRLSEKEGDR
jgi:CcmD family protein